MTLGEGKKKVYELMDEYSSGGSVTKDADIEAKMADFFDIAQKQVSKIQKILKVYSVPLASGVTEYAVPSDFGQIYKVWRSGSVTGKYAWKGGKIIISDAPSSVELEYFAVPATVDVSTDDSYEFQVREDACQAMCFFVAAQQLVVDLVIDYSALYQMYQNMLGLLDTSVPGAAADNVRNVFFRG
jgi:hypothetical protein